MSDREVKLIISADGGVAIAATKEVADSFKKLSAQSVADINKQKQDVTAAYETIKKSGIVSAAEIVQAEAAKNKQIQDLNQQLLGSNVSLGSQLKAHWLGVTAAIGAAWAATSTAREFARMGADALLVESAYDSMSKSAGIAGKETLDAMKEASQGTIEDTDLMRKALKAMALGMTGDMLKGISDASVKASIIAGTTVGEAYERIIDAVSTGQYRALIRMGALTKQQSMWLNQALSGGAQPEELQEIAVGLIVVNEKLRDLGDTSRQPALEMQRWKANVEEFQESLGKVEFYIAGAWLKAWQKAGAALYDAIHHPFENIIGPGVESTPGQRPASGSTGTSPSDKSADQKKREDLERQAKQLASAGLGKELDAWKVSVQNMNPYLSEASKKLAELNQKAGELRKGGKGELTEEQKATVETLLQQGKGYLAIIENAKVANAKAAAAFERTTATLGVTRQEEDLRLKLRAATGEDTDLKEVENKYRYERQQIEAQITQIKGMRVFSREDQIAQAAKLAVLRTQNDALGTQQALEENIINANRQKQSITSEIDHQLQLSSSRLDIEKQIADITFKIASLNGEDTPIAEIHLRYDLERKSIREQILANENKMVGATQQQITGLENTNTVLREQLSAKDRLEEKERALAALSSNKERVNATLQALQDIRGYESDYYDWSLKKIDEQAQAFRKAHVDPRAIAAWTEDQETRALIKRDITGGDVTAGYNAQARQYALDMKSAGQYGAEAFTEGMSALKGGFLNIFQDLRKGELKSFGDYMLDFANRISSVWENMLSEMLTNWIMTGSAMRSSGVATGNNGGFGDLLNKAGSWMSGLFGGTAGVTGTGASVPGYSTGYGDWTLGLGFSRGAAFSHGRIVPFGHGTVVTEPTFFPMAQGAVGLMGEAGHEAIMPLARDSSGNLGIRAQASQPNTTVVQHFNFATIDGQSTARWVYENRDKFASAVQGAMKNNHPLRRG